MSATQIRRLCNLVAVGMTGVAILVAGWSVAPSVLEGVLGSPEDAEELLVAWEPESKPAADGKPFNDDVWNRPLRQGFSSLTSKPSRSAQPPKKRPIAVPRNASIASRTVNSSVGGLRLVGTVIEAGRSVAIVSNPTGQLAFCGVGESFAIDPSGVEVKDIRDGEITVEMRGKTQQLRLGMQVDTAMTKPIAEDVHEMDMRDIDLSHTPIESRVDEPMETEPAEREPLLSLDEELDFLNGDFDDDVE